MKGVVFTLFGEMVEEQMGFAGWDDLIESTRPASDGVYVGTQTYADSELLDYVGALAEKTGTPATDLVRAFGHYMIGRFAAMHPAFFVGHDVGSFLKSVHDVIHVEVAKLHPDAILPTFDYESHDEGLIMLYRSPRRLCALAEGLIAGAAEHFGQAVEVAHPVCMLEGADHCRLELSISECADERVA